MKRALVTGATGFVGANLARRLLQDGHQVHCTVLPAHSAWRLDPIRADLHLHEADIADGEGLASVLLRIRPEWIFHLAVHGAYSWQTDLDRMVRTNVMGTINLVEASLGVGFEAFVNTGSSSEYGIKDHAPAETDLLEPNSHYAVTKASSTLFCRHTAQSRGVRLPTLRLYSVYGPWEEPGRLVPNLVVRGLAGKLPALASPETARDFVYVDDVCEAYVLAAARVDQPPDAIYNVGTGVGTALRELVAVARSVFRIEAEPVWGSMPPRAWDTNVWRADNRLIRAALGWQPRHDVETGLRRTAEWFMSCPAMLPRYEAPAGS